jgi:hypothetical protein
MGSTSFGRKLSVRQTSGQQTLDILVQLTFGQWQWPADFTVRWFSAPCKNDA